MAFKGKSITICLFFSIMMVCESKRLNKMSESVYQPNKGKGAAVVEEVSNKIRSSGVFPEDFKFLCRIAWVESKYGTAHGTYRSGYYGGIWQVDKIGFIDTQKRPSLRKYYPSIQRAFGIDWTQTSWEDLLQPFYSGLAARLVLATIPHPIPNDVRRQAEQWKKYYNTEKGKGSVDKFIEDVEKATGCAR